MPGARRARTPPTYEALRQMPADRETLVSLKRAAEKTRRSTTSPDRNRRRRCAPSSGARCRRTRQKRFRANRNNWNPDDV